MAIVVLYECRMTVKMIHQTLKPLSVKKRFVSRALAHYQETDDVVDQPREGSRRRSAHKRQTINAIYELVR